MDKDWVLIDTIELKDGVDSASAVEAKYQQEHPATAIDHAAIVPCYTNTGRVKYCLQIFAKTSSNQFALRDDFEYHNAVEALTKLKAQFADTAESVELAIGCVEAIRKLANTLRG